MEPIPREREEERVDGEEEGGGGGRTIISSNLSCEEGRADWKRGMERDGRTDKGSGLEDGLKRLEILLLPRENENEARSDASRLTRNFRDSLQPHQNLHPPPLQFPNIKTPSPSLPPARRVPPHHVQIARRKSDERDVQTGSFGFEEGELSGCEKGEVGYVA